MSTHRFAACRIVGLVAAAVAIGCAWWPHRPRPPSPCPDVEVVFARGTSEPPGSAAPGRFSSTPCGRRRVRGSVDVYAVDYQASSNFAAGVDFARTVVDGIRDAGAHIEATAANCPKTRIVLGGYSQGAALAGYVTAAAIPDSVPAGSQPRTSRSRCQTGDRESRCGRCTVR